MRVVEKNEREKRGCIYCLDIKGKTNSGKYKHNKCPYRELDEFENYEDYFKAQGGVLGGIFMEDI